MIHCGGALVSVGRTDFLDFNLLSFNVAFVSEMSYWLNNAIRSSPAQKGSAVHTAGLG